MSRNTLDTTTLQVRDVIALNPNTNNFIASNYRPVIGDKGKVQWQSSEEFLSSMYLSSISTNVLVALTDPSYIDSNYVTPDTLSTTVANLSLVNKYISATTLYDCFVNLGSMNTIGNELGPMIFGSNLSGGYVSTVNPGEYRVYQSTVSVVDTNLDFVSTSVNRTLSSITMNLLGFSNHYVNTSKLRIDIHGSVIPSFYGGLSDNCYMSTFLVNPLWNTRVGDVIKTRLPPYMSNTQLGPFSFFLSGADLTMGLSSLSLCHRYNTLNNDPCDFTTIIPSVGGVFATLNNMD
jgi:hypothetical protein